jgi:hypothetical protein
MAENDILTLEYGEMRTTGRQALRAYFFAVSPTNKFFSIERNPFTKNVYTKPESTEYGNRIVHCTVKILQPFILRVRFIYTVGGRATNEANIELDVWSMREEISLTGYQGFGRFEGRAHVITDINHAAFGGITYKLIRPPVTEKMDSHNAGLIW